MTQIRSTNRPRIGISSCLLGENVRYDGGNKKNVFITDELSRLFEFISFCPEVAAGMGIPRPPIQLIDFNGQVRALGIKNPALDMTGSLTECANHINHELAELSGYIFKCRSPSCGINDVKVLFKDQAYDVRGQGIFAAEIMKRFPHLPVIDEQQLTNTRLQQLFLDRVYQHYQAMK